GAVEPLGGGDVAEDDLAEQPLLVGEVLVHGLLAHRGQRRDLVHAGALVALAQEQNGGRFHDRLVLAGRLRPLTWLHRASQASDTRLASIKGDTVLTSIHYHASPGHPRAAPAGQGGR